MLRYVTWGIAWLLMMIWCLAVRPFIPGLYAFEPCIPFLVTAIMLGPTKLALPLILLTGVLLDVFQPFPRPYAFVVLLLLAGGVSLAVRFFLANRSFYSALVLVVVARITAALAIFALGAGAALWPAEKAILTNIGFFSLTTFVDALLLLIAFRLVARPLVGGRRARIAL